MTTQLTQFNVSKSSNKLEIIFSSTLDNIDKANAETKKFLIELGLEEQLFPICLVMREGLTNAVKHGHRFDFEKIVHYSLLFNNESIVMEILDQGEGFDWRAAQEKEPSPDKDHGRGIPIMKEYFSKVSYNSKGNHVIITKHL
ncbi:MAG: ATP-binding protein [Desulfobacterales bacterium]|nr:ATP-binding protein [Desulfobacterales bacterium]